MTYNMIDYSYILLILKAHHSPPSPLALVAVIAERTLRRERGHSVNSHQIQAESHRIQAEISKGPDCQWGMERG